MRLSQINLLAANEQPVPLLHADRDDPDRVALGVHLKKDPEAVVRAKAQFPCPREDGGLLQWLTIARLDVRLVQERLLDLVTNQWMISLLHGPEVPLDLRGVSQGERPPPRHMTIIMVIAERRSTQQRATLRG